MRLGALSLGLFGWGATVGCGEERAPVLDSRVTLEDDQDEDEMPMEPQGGAGGMDIKVPTDPDAIIAMDPEPTGLRFAWPLAGVMNVDWVVHNYVDLDRAEGTLVDYAGGSGEAAKTYDGHLGVDIDIATFREMDQGVPVLAAAAGVVTYVQDGNFDRNLSIAPSCFGTANSVFIEHDDGSEARYLHFREGSLMVADGESVQVGTPLGLVGSSGCSTAPHVHFEVRNGAGEVLDPFREGLFVAPPAYSTEIGVMGHYLRDEAFEDVSEVYESLTQPENLGVGQEMGIAVVAGGGRIGDELRVFVERPDGTRFGELVREWDQEYRWSTWWWNRTPDDPGTWSGTVFVNDIEQYSFEFEVGQ